MIGVSNTCAVLSASGATLREDSLAVEEAWRGSTSDNVPPARCLRDLMARSE